LSFLLLLVIVLSVLLLVIVLSVLLRFTDSDYALKEKYIHNIHIKYNVMERLDI
jgi:hypothetical protein